MISAILRPELFRTFRELPVSWSAITAHRELSINIMTREDILKRKTEIEVRADCKKQYQIEGNSSLWPTSHILWLLILIQSTRLRQFFSVAEQQAGLSGVWEQMIYNNTLATLCFTAGRGCFFFLTQHMGDWLVSQNGTSFHCDQLHNRYLCQVLCFCACCCDILPGLTVIMVFELTVAAMPLRKLSKLIFASAMKSTLNEEWKLKQQWVILNINTQLGLRYPRPCFSSVQYVNGTWQAGTTVK